MVLQAIHRIVGGAKRDDVEPLEDALRAQLRRGQELAGLLPDALRAGFVEQLVDAEVAFQLEVGPVIERVAQGVGHRSCPGLEFLERRRRARAKCSATPLARIARHL